jgi:isopentenyldiphosphate isomerase
MKDEYVDVIDKNDNELGIKKLKSVVYREGDWHRGAHLWIVKDGKILLQKRASGKEFFPNCFDVACGGHVSSGENFIDTLVREVKEELGLNIDKEKIIFLDKRNQISKDEKKGLISKEVLGVFLYLLEEPLENLVLQEEEVSEVRLFEIDELKYLLKNRPEMFVEDREYFLETIDKIEKFLSK